MQRLQRAALGWTAVCALAACGKRTAPIDAHSEAIVGPECALEPAGGGAFGLFNRSGIDLEAGAPRMVLPLDGVQLGVVPALDDAQSYDPFWLEEDNGLFKPVAPDGLAWLTPTTAVWRKTAEDAATIVYAFGSGASATLTLSAGASGCFEAKLVPELTDGRAVAYMRLRPHAGTGDRYYGLGEWFDRPEHTGMRRPMQLEVDPTLESANSENHVAVPFIVATGGWGLFVQSTRPGLFDVAKKQADVVEVTFGTGADSSGGLTFHLFAASRALDIPRQYYAVAGAPALPAPWALGPWVWRNESRDEAQVLDDIAQLRSRDLATSGLWLDRPYATKVSSFDFDTRRFPAPADVFTRAKAAGLAMALWHAPYLEEGSEPFRTQAMERGFFPPEAPTALSGWGKPVDFTAPGALEWWRENLRHYTDAGVQGFKLDYAEDVVVGLSGVRSGWKFADGSDERTMHHGYTMLYHEAYAGLFEPESSFLLVRAGRWGSQRFAPIVWPGDIDATLTKWKEPVGPEADADIGVGGLASAVSATLSLGPSGFPFFAGDTGGYRHAPPDKETWIRWVEQSALGTVMQTGDASSQMPWEFNEENGRDDEALAVYRQFARLHLRLFPYVWTLAKDQAAGGTPPIRALGLAHPELGVHPADEYMLGWDLLVAPVVTAGATTRTLTLPPGRWLGWFDGVWHDGGTGSPPVELTVDAPLTTLPLFIREGGIVPMLRPTIDTLRESADEGVDSFANDSGVLFVRLAPGVDNATLLYDRTAIYAVDDMHYKFEGGTVFKQGAVFEIIGASTPNGVRLNRLDAPQGDLAAVSGGTAAGWAHEDTTGGTLWIRVPAGLVDVELY